MFCLCIRIPVWPYAKLILTCWLVLPYFSGAAYVYEHYVRPIFLNPQTINIWYVPRKKDYYGKPDDILAAAEKYIQENGTQAFETLIHRVFFLACTYDYCDVLLSLYLPRFNNPLPLLRRLRSQGGTMAVQFMMRAMDTELCTLWSEILYLK